MNASARLRRWEKISLGLAAVFIVAFGALTELRSCFQKSNRKTDFGVFLRAAWAVRSGADLYTVSCDNGWHYPYPPALAVLLTPLADAPKGFDRAGLPPFWLSVAIWTLFNFFLVARMTHVLAKLAFPNEPPGTRRWWYARTVPVYVALGGIGFTIGHGQVNVLMVALLVEMLRAGRQGKFLQSGCWLAASITLKIIPAYLLLYPLFKREGRTLAGVALGFAIGLGAIPLAGLGFERTVESYKSLLNHVILPGAGGGDGGVMNKELIDVAATDSQSFLSVIHNNLYPDRLKQPKQASRETRLTHYACIALLTLAVFVQIRRRGLHTVHDDMLLLGLLSLILMHATPVSHMHYYALGFPLGAALWLKGMAGTPQIFPGWRLTAPLIIWAIGTALPLFPGAICEACRHRGLGLASSLILIAVGLRELGAGRAAAILSIEDYRNRSDQMTQRLAA